MAKVTKREAILAYLRTAWGYRFVKRTQKYEVFERSDGMNLYVGKRGALRAGRTVADSVPIDKTAAWMVKEGTACLEQAAG